MKTKTVLGLMACVSFLASCGNSYEQLQKASWLLGNWENRMDGMVISESWKQLDDSTYSGNAEFLLNGEVVSSEQIQLEERNGALYYVPTVNNQNDGNPVRFTMTKGTASELVFENPGHDFPQKISYTLINPDSIVAVISGIYESQESSESFPMKRVK